MGNGVKLLQRIARLGRLEKIKVEGFKSLKNIEIEFPTKVTILIGPNASGKTALVEVFELLQNIREYVEGQTLDPISKWWRFENISWMHSNNPIRITLKLDYRDLPEKIEEVLNEKEVKTLHEYDIKYLKDVFSIPLSITYQVSVSSNGSKIAIADEAIVEAHSLDLNIRLKTEENELKIVMDSLKIKQYIEKNLEELTNQGVKFYCERVVYKFLCENESRELLRNLYRKLISEVARNLDGGELSIPTSVEAPSLLKVLNDIMEDIKRLDFSGIMEFFIIEIVDGVSAVIEGVAGPILEEQFPTLKEQSRDKLLKDVIEALSIIFNGALRVSDLAFAAVILVGGFIHGIEVLKHVDVYRVSEPQRPARQYRLRPNAENLVSFIHTMYSEGGVGFIRGLEAVVRDVMRVDSVSIGFGYTGDGRVFLKLIVDGKFELLPPSIPAGVWKAMAIEAAVLSGPSILLVDEFENSLHVEAQEYLLSEIRDSGVTAIIATHSPVVIDLARSLDELLLLEYKDYETKAYRFKESKELQEKLEKLGLTVSEAVLYRIIPRG